MRGEWQRLHQAGLPSEVRVRPDPSHRPHATLWAGEQLAAETDEALSDRLRGADVQPGSAEGAALPLALHLGPLTLFGPHRGHYVLVHAIVPSVALLELQRRVAELCGAHPEGRFGPGRWSAHVTVARRLPATQVPEALGLLATGSAVDHPVRVSQCRRWDSIRRRTWLL